MLMGRRLDPLAFVSNPGHNSESSSGHSRPPKSRHIDAICSDPTLGKCVLGDRDGEFEDDLKTSELGIGAAQLPKGDLALGEFSECLRWILQQGEVGICIRLLRALETSSIGLQHVGGKSASEFRHFLRSFMEKDHLNHPDPTIRLLEHWASHEGACDSESPGPSIQERKKRRGHLSAKHFQSGPPENSSNKVVLPQGARKSSRSNTLTDMSTLDTEIPMTGVIPAHAEPEKEALKSSSKAWRRSWAQSQNFASNRSYIVHDKDVDDFYLDGGGKAKQSTDNSNMSSFCRDGELANCLSKIDDDKQPDPPGPQDIPRSNSTKSKELKAFTSIACEHRSSESCSAKSQGLDDCKDKLEFGHHIATASTEPGASPDSLSDSSDDQHLDPDDFLDDSLADPTSPAQAPTSRSSSMKLDSSRTLDFSAIEANDARWFATKSHRFMIHPNSNKRMAWDIASLVLILTESITIPLVLGFNMFMPEAWFWFSTAFFTLDIILNLLTGYFRDGLLVMRQSMVLRRYLRTYFIIDFCSTMPWEFILSSGQDCNRSECGESSEASLVKLARIGKLLRVLRLLRLMKLRHLLERIEDMFPSYLFSVTLNLMKVLTLFALLCHWSACIWGYIGNPTKVGHPTAHLPPYKYADCEPGGPCEAGLDGSPWLRRYGYDSMGLGAQYLAALHFAVGLVTANEMDIRPGYWGERLYSILLMIISLSVTSVVISQAVVILNKINQGRAEFRENMQTVKEFMRSRKVPIPLQAKVKRYLEYQFKCMKHVRVHTDFTEELSPWLRLELTEHLNKDIITRHPFFKDLSSTIIKHFCARAMTVLYAPGDVVFQRGHLASCICFIVNGKLRILSKTHTENKTSIMTSPSWIGDTTVFVETVRKFTIVSITHSELLTISKEVLMEVLKEFPKLKSKYMAFRQMVEAGDFIGCGSQCQHCMLFGHNLADCPSLASGKAGNLSLPVGFTSENNSRRPSLASNESQGFLVKLKEKCRIMRGGSEDKPRMQRRRSSGSIQPLQSAEERENSRDPPSPRSFQGSPPPSPSQIQREVLV